jgi:hypothetical protein
MQHKMATPTIKDDEILDAIKTRLEAITTTGGSYYNTFTNKVFKNKPTPMEATGINIRDDSDVLAGSLVSSADLEDIEFDVEIDVVAIGADLQNILKIKADILKSIGTDLAFSGKAYHTQYVGYTRNKFDQLGNKLGDLTIRIKIWYRKTAWSA